MVWSLQHESNVSRQQNTYHFNTMVCITTSKNDNTMKTNHRAKQGNLDEYLPCF